MSQLLVNNSTSLNKKRTKCELLIEQKVQILEYRAQHPTLKLTQLIQHFNKLFKDIRRLDFKICPSNENTK